MPLILLDTSCWIEVLRVDGNPSVQKIVAELLLDDRLLWCEMVVLELWNGARGSKERTVLKEFERILKCLPIDAKIWSGAKTLALACRLRGITVSVTDLLIAMCAIENKVEFWHRDKHFSKIPGLDQRFVT